jgi:hypothetical protein
MLNFECFFDPGQSSEPTGNGASPTPFCDEGVAATRWPASEFGFNFCFKLVRQKKGRRQISAAARVIGCVRSVV